jgi:TolB protein
MTKKILPIPGLAVAVALAAAAALAAQQTDILVKVTGGERPAIAIPDFRGSGDAQKQMETFNRTLWDDVQASGLFKMAPKSMYPLQTPQQPQDFRPPLAPPARPARRGAPPPKPVRQGPWLDDWSGPPVNANYLAFGYTAIQGDRLVLFGWLYDVTQADPSGAQVIGKLYFGSPDPAGARKVAQEFASDILSRFGGKSLMGSRIFFVSTRTGNKEIWSMDYDGSNQKQLTFYKTISTFPAVSPDGSKIAFTSYLRGNPTILVHSVETGRDLRFYNQAASMNAASDFTPDGQQLVFSSTAGSQRYAQLFIAGVDGGNFRRLSNSQSIEVEPKVNPKTGREIVFVSGRSGMPQIYKMNMDGADVVRLTSGEGEAVNPAWHPDGQHIAFAWTRGYEPGNYNIFVMDVATRQFVQLTHGTGRNENPSWAPDGRHIVFSSNREGGQQVWTMQADGKDLKRLTTQGINEKPVWSKQ